jgi:hypothetical protein
MRAPKKPRRHWRIILSLMLLVHLAAVAVPPFSFASGRSSPVAASFYNALRPYIQWMYLDHGYFFFAPNPGASHLVRYRITASDNEVVEGVLPDMTLHRPRLLYHRYFMLSESLNAFYAPPNPPGESVNQNDQMERWRRSRELYEVMWDSYERHLQAHHRAVDVELKRVKHRPPSPYEFGNLKMRLDDSSLYIDLAKNDIDLAKNDEREVRP